MEKSEFDYAVDDLLDRQRLVTQELVKRFKRTKPFRQEPISNEELIYHYSQITPDMEMNLRRTIGDDVYDNYQSRMIKLLRRRQNG